MITDARVSRGRLVTEDSRNQLSVPVWDSHRTSYAAFLMLCPRTSIAVLAIWKEWRE